MQRYTNWIWESLCFALLQDVLCGNFSVQFDCSLHFTLMTDQKVKYSPRGLFNEFVGGVQEDPEDYQSVVKGECQLVYDTMQSPFSPNL